MMTKLKAWLGRTNGTLWFRASAAVLFVCLHVVAFDIAGHERLGVPFNNAPGEAPHYNDPKAPSLGPHPRQPEHWSRLVVSRWDSQHYVGFATRGLGACPRRDELSPDKQIQNRQYLNCGLGWSPTIGVIGGFISRFLHLPPDYTLFGMVLIIAVLLNLLWTSQVIRDRLGAGVAYGALIAFNTFPSSFYTVALYTEGATIALGLLGFVLLAKDRWVLAGIAAGASSAFRLPGLAFGFGVGCAALWAAYERRKAGTPKWWRPLAGIPFTACGWFAVMLLEKIVLGNPFVQFQAGAAFSGGRGMEWSHIIDLQFYLKGFSAQHVDTVAIVASFAFIALAGREVLSRFSRPEAIFLVAATALSMFLPIEAAHQYWGLNRYFLVPPLTFLCLGVIGRRHTALYVGWVVLALVLYWNVEMCSFVAQGDPRVCPCLGRVEWMEPWQS